MSFNSFEYLLLFLPLVVILYHLFRTTGGANIVILAASYIFYGASGLWFLIPLMVTSLIDFYVGLKLSQTDKASYRKFLLVVSLSANLGLLAFFKYAPWLIASANDALVWFGMSFALPALAVTLPPGISFYTFQTMSYTIEVYRREMKATRNLVDYMAFVTFWPHLVAGPIMRARNLLRQLETVRPVVSSDEARHALLLIAWGLFKKIVLADNFGHIVDQIDAHVRSGSAWAGAGLLFAYAFAGQIYCDFSAYTDIARGSAKLIGIDLVRNFHTPYFATSPSEFWRRWHISLSTWLRDYLYIPLGGNRFGRLIEFRNLMITMTLGGLWHGAGILFVAWGIWHGFLLILYRLLPIDTLLTRWFGMAGKWLSILLVFHLVCFGWILFRAHTDTFIPMMNSIGALFTAADLSTFKLVGRGVLLLGIITLLTDYIGYRKNGEFGDFLRTVAAVRGSGNCRGLLFRRYDTRQARGDGVHILPVLSGIWPTG
jgi:D-alanyl-lipoteichoic acid acyltransferase DltB (MBOAT superfamily)